MMAFRSIPSAERGDIDKARFCRCDLAECRGLEKIEGAGLKSRGKGERDTLLTGYCDSELPGCCGSVFSWV